MNIKYSSISENHQKELLGSAISPEIISLNFLSVESDEVYDLLFYSPGLERTNTGGLTAGVLKQYAHLEYGGWWCSGLDVLTLENSMWGCFKPNCPRQSAEKKIIKYEHPCQLPTEVFCLKVGRHQWGQIAKKAGIDCPDLLAIANDQIPSLFWQWIKDNSSIPIIVTEGAKKTASLLSHGYAALGLPGIYGGYRTPKDENKEPTGESRYLVPQLEAFCQEGREFVFAFDNDKKESTAKAVKTAIARTGELVETKGCKVSVMVWSFDVKGIDDLVTKYQETNLDNIFFKRISLSEHCPQIPFIKDENLPPLKDALSLLVEQDISSIEELDKLAQIKGLYRRLYSPFDVETLFNKIKANGEEIDASAAIKALDLIAINQNSLNLVEVIPESLASALTHYANQLSLRPEVLFLILLTGINSQHQQGTEIQLTNDFSCPPNLFGGIVAKSGQLKSPAIKAIAHKPLIYFQRQAAEVYQNKLIAYQLQLKEYKLIKDPDELAARFPDGEPKEPKMEIFYSSDMTFEALGDRLGSQSRGILALNDELSGLFYSLNQYKKAGNDGQRLLELYNGNDSVIIRKSSPDKNIVSPNLCIIGGIQPKVLEKLCQGGDDDGLWARFLVSGHCNYKM